MVDTAAAALPAATPLSFAGQDHNADPAVIAPQLIDFFTAPDRH